MRIILNLSQLFGWQTLHVTFNLAYFTGSAEIHCVTLERNTYIRILKPGICLIVSFGWFNVTNLFYFCDN